MVGIRKHIEQFVSRDPAGIIEQYAIGANTQVLRINDQVLSRVIYQKIFDIGICETGKLPKYTLLGGCEGKQIMYVSPPSNAYRRFDENIIVAATIVDENGNRVARYRGVSSMTGRIRCFGKPRGHWYASCGACMLCKNFALAL